MSAFYTDKALLSIEVPHDMIIPETAVAVIKKYNMLPSGCRVILGLSGGADSVSLLHILWSLRELYALEILAVHVNHGIRGAEAELDEKFVSKLCRSLGIKLDTYHYDVPKEAMRMKLSIEEAGRALRYQSFQRSLKNVSGKIAVAHNKNDNAETVLMRMFRGTGTKGLAGIPPVRGNIIRPLIMTSRAKIEDFCRENNISYRTDSTNLKNIYTRNLIRLEMLPLVEPAALENISRMCGILNEENEYLDNLALEALRRCMLDTSSLSIPLLVGYPMVLRRRIVRLFLLPYTQDNRDISYEHVNMALELTNRKTGREICLPFGLRLVRNYDLLTVPAAEPAAFCYELPLDVTVSASGISVTASLKKPDNYFDNICTKIFSYDRIEKVLQVRSRRAGDKIYVRSMGGNKKIKDYFIDAKIPQIKRGTIPLLTCGEDVVWIMDEGNYISDLYKSDDATHNRIYISRSFL